jgi:hypothetical protein
MASQDDFGLAAPLCKDRARRCESEFARSKYIGYPNLILQDPLEQANGLEKFLIDSFTLLMSSISVMEAESIKKQA